MLRGYVSSHSHVSGALGSKLGQHFRSNWEEIWLTLLALVSEYFSPLIFKATFLLISVVTRYKGERSWLSRIHLDVGLSNPQRSFLLSLLRGIGGRRQGGGGKETFKSAKESCVVGRLRQVNDSGVTDLPVDITWGPLSLNDDPGLL